MYYIVFVEELGNFVFFWYYRFVYFGNLLFVNKIFFFVGIKIFVYGRKKFLCVN